MDASLLAQVVEAKCNDALPVDRQRDQFERMGVTTIDNGQTEPAIRRPCVGHNNYLFSGSLDAAERLAGAYTLVLSCRNVGIDVRPYLLDVIQKIEGGWPLRRIGELVPDRWAALHASGAAGHQAGQ